MEEMELVKQMIVGDMDAFDRLMDLYRPKALRIAYLISGNHMDSEDIVQEAFVTCYLKRRDIRNAEAFRSWFYRMLSRIAWRMCRKRRMEQPSEELYPNHEAAPGELLTDFVKREEESIIYQAILQLPVKHRTVLVFYYYDQMSIREIAHVCGCLEGTVKSRLHHGKQKLRAILEQQDTKGDAVWTILS